jgi:hypothetical protein
MLLFVFSARAAAEGLPTVIATSSSAAAEEAPAQTPPPPTPAAEAVTSKPVEATEAEAAALTASVAAESETRATRSAASSAIPPHPSTTDFPGSEGNAVSNSRKGATAIPSTDRALELARTARRIPAEATAAMADSARSTAETVNRAGVLDPVHTLPHHPRQMASGALQMVRGALPSAVEALTLPEGLEDLRSSGGVPPEVGADAFSLPATSAIPRTATAEPAGNLAKPLSRNLLDFAGVEPPPPAAPGLSTSSSRGHPDLGPGGGNLGDVFAGSVDERLADFTPPDGNAPLPAPGSSQGESAGAAGTSFIPIAALLALLALAAPAILRRLGRVPDLRPQTPFVCALERPG